MQAGKLSYPEAKALLVDRLVRDAWAHENDEYTLIGHGYDDIDVGLPRNAGPEFRKLFIALSFWDGWIDARNHEWQYYKPIEKDDWPRLARQIAGHLKNEQEIDEPTIVARFG